jgi:hypothetical protein
MMPLFLKFAANPAALDWIYAYRVDWDRPIGAAARQEEVERSPSRGVSRGA